MFLRAYRVQNISQIFGSAPMRHPWTRLAQLVPFCNGLSGTYVWHFHRHVSAIVIGKPQKSMRFPFRARCQTVTDETNMVSQRV